jgi:hypothetical protein
MTRLFCCFTLASATLLAEQPTVDLSKLGAAGNLRSLKQFEALAASAYPNSKNATVLRLRGQGVGAGRGGVTHAMPIPAAKATIDSIRDHMRAGVYGVYGYKIGSRKLLISVSEKKRLFVEGENSLVQFDGDPRLVIFTGRKVLLVDREGTLTRESACSAAAELVPAEGPWTYQLVVRDSIIFDNDLRTDAIAFFASIFNLQLPSPDELARSREMRCSFSSSKCNCE